jgi:5-oxoprolinase (ATP-hydrolysing) subunit A
MRETVRAARDRRVAIGAHPSYPDVPGFGRRELGLDAREIARHVATQISALSDVCHAERARLTHVKPHGALYNRAARDPKAARAVANAIRGIDRDLILLGLAGSEMMRAALRAGIPFASEAFVDRAYTSGLLLVPRDQPGALIDDVGGAVRRAIAIVQQRIVKTVDGVELPLDAVSLCVHGDNPNALRILRELRSGLESAGVRIAPFVS